MRLYRSILGPEFDQLSPELQKFHDETDAAEGLFTVTHDPRLISRLLIPLMCLPKAGINLPMTLNIAIQNDEETWTRCIGPSKLVSYQSNENGILKEKTGPLTFRFNVSVIGGGMEFSQKSCALLKVPLPNCCSPNVKAKITPTDRGWAVLVVISFGNINAICQYVGEAHIR